MGTADSPYSQVTVYKVVGADNKDYLQVTQTIQHVNASTQFHVAYVVQNITSASSGPAPGTGVTVPFRATEAADTYIDGTDTGRGVFNNTSPRFVGGGDPSTADTGATGGLLEVAGSTWSHYQEDSFSTIWSQVGNTAPFMAGGLQDTVLTTDTDNGVGAQWDDHYSSGLAPGATATYVTTWKFFAPLLISPASASQQINQQHSVTVTLLNSAGTPLAGQIIRYTISGAKPISSSTTTGTNGQATISWTRTSATTSPDILQAYADLNNNSTHDATEPQATALVNWTSGAPPTGGAGPQLHGTHMTIWADPAGALQTQLGGTTDPAVLASTDLANSMNGSGTGTGEFFPWTSPTGNAGFFLGFPADVPGSSPPATTQTPSTTPPTNPPQQGIAGTSTTGTTTTNPPPVVLGCANKTGNTTTGACNPVKVNMKTGSFTVVAIAQEAGDQFSLTATIDNAKAAKSSAASAAAAATPKVYGTGSATATAPGPVAITVNPTKAARKALKRHHHVNVTVHLSFRSSAHLGSATSTKDFRVAVKSKGKKKH